MNAIAIDPGASGGLAWKLGSESGAFALPKTPGELVNRLKALRHEVQVAFIEDIPKFTGAKLPGSTMAVLFHSFGFIEGVLMAYGYAVVRIKPQAWQKALGLGTREKGQAKAEWKRKLKSEAERRFPHVDVTLATSDALLILLAGLLNPPTVVSTASALTEATKD